MIEFIIGGAVVAFITAQLTYRGYAARIRQLEEAVESWKKSARTWEQAADRSHEANMRMQQTNGDLLELVAKQKLLIEKLAHGNKDVPARNN